MLIIMLIVLADCFSADKIRIFLCRLVESGNLDALPVSYCSIIPFFFFFPSFSDEPTADAHITSTNQHEALRLRAALSATESSQ